MPRCVVSRWHNLWGVRRPGDWDRFVEADLPLRSEGLYRYLGAKYSMVSFGLVTTTEDVALRSWYGRDPDSCRADVGPSPAATLEESVAGVEVLLESLPSWQALVVEGDQHGLLDSPGSGRPRRCASPMELDLDGDRLRAPLMLRLRAGR